MYSLLGVASSWSQYFQKLKEKLGNYSGTYDVLNSVFEILSIVLWVVLGIVGAVGAIYAIYLGVKLARADEQSKRDEAKKHLITVAIAVGVTVVLILFFNTFLPMILDAFNIGGAGGLENGNGEGGSTGGGGKA